MDPVRVLLLLTVFIVETAIGGCESTGDFKDIVTPTERYPWHILKAGTSTHLPRNQAWNSEVELTGCWENFYSSFKLSCSRKKGTGGGYLYRAILSKNYEEESAMTWDVLGCTENLIKSVSVVNYENDNFAFYIFRNNKPCETYFYDRKAEGAKFKWVLTRYYGTDVNYCHNMRATRKNNNEYTNGWNVGKPFNPGMRAENCR